MEALVNIILHVLETDRLSGLDLFCDFLHSLFTWFCNRIEVPLCNPQVVPATGHELFDDNLVLLSSFKAELAKNFIFYNHVA